MKPWQLAVYSSVLDLAVVYPNSARLAQRACCSLPRAQRGRVSARRAEGCGLSPSPREDRRVSRPAACVLPAGHTACRPARGEGGVRWGGGPPDGGRRWWGGHGKSGFIFPILHLVCYTSSCYLTLMLSAIIQELRHTSFLNSRVFAQAQSS